MSDFFLDLMARSDLVRKVDASGVAWWVRPDVDVSAPVSPLSALSPAARASARRIADMFSKAPK